MMFNLRNIIRCREDLMCMALDQFIGVLLEGTNIDDLVKVLQRRLPSGAGYDAVFESVRYLAGHPLLATEAYRLAWRLAGNIPRLRSGESVLPWMSQHADEWVPLEVLRGVFTKNKYRSIGYEFTFRVMAGTSCPMKIRAFWKLNVARFIANEVGFSKPWGKFPFGHAMQLVGLRFCGRIEAARSREAPEFHEVKCPPSMVKWNRDNVLRLRLRAGEHCPNGWLNACHKCAVGYSSCRAATHYSTYERDTCQSCGDIDALFDPEEPSSHCLVCAQKERLRREL